MQRGSDGGQVSALRQRSLQRMPPCASSTQSALAQSASLVHAVPAAPVPRAPSVHATVEPCEVQACVAGQS